MACGGAGAVTEWEHSNLSMLNFYHRDGGREAAAEVSGETTGAFVPGTFSVLSGKIFDANKHLYQSYMNFNLFCFSEKCGRASLDHPGTLAR